MRETQAGSRQGDVKVKLELCARAATVQPTMGAFVRRISGHALRMCLPVLLYGLKAQPHARFQQLPVMPHL
jgi:hypothetical protein